MQGFTRIECGGNHLVGLRADGTVAAWGFANSTGTDIPALAAPAVAIAAGDGFTTILLGDGTVATAGPSAVFATGFPDLDTIRSVACTDRSVALVDDAGGVRIVGDLEWSNSGNVPFDLGAVAMIAATHGGFCALGEDGSVRTWGSTSTLNPPALNGVAEVTGGGSHFVARLADGGVACWGSNTSGQCNVPAKIGGAVMVAAGDAFSLAMRANGTMVGWGSNADGALNTPALGAGARAIDAGNAHAVAVRADGTVVAWGASTSGQLAVPAGLDQVEAIACSGFATIALRADGSVVSWGGGTNPANGPSPAPAYATGISMLAAKGSIALGVRGPVIDDGPFGDLDGDGVVNAADLAILLGAWGSASSTADLDGDGQVNAADLALLLGAWS